MNNTPTTQKGRRDMNQLDDFPDDFAVENTTRYIEKAKEITKQFFPWWTHDGQSDELVLKIASILQAEQSRLIKNRNDYYDAMDRHNKSL